MMEQPLQMGVNDPIALMFRNEKRSRETAEHFRELTGIDVLYTPSGQVFIILAAIFNLVLRDLPRTDSFQGKWNPLLTTLLKMSHEGDDPGAPVATVLRAQLLPKLQIRLEGILSFADEIPWDKAIAAASRMMYETMLDTRAEVAQERTEGQRRFSEIRKQKQAAFRRNDGEVDPLPPEMEEDIRRAQDELAKAQKQRILDQIGWTPPTGPRRQQKPPEGPIATILQFFKGKKAG